MMRAILVCLFTTILALAACSSEPVNPKVYADPVDTVRVLVGEQFKIVLEANPSTGYSWQFRLPFDSAFLKLVEKQHIPKPNPEKLVGRGGYDHWLFEALAKGTTSISLHYLRVWDSTSVEQTVDFTIEIKEE